MQILRYVSRFSLPILLITVVSIVKCGLIENVNEAILSNFYEDIANGIPEPEEAANSVHIPEVATNAISTPEAISERFIKQFTHNDNEDVVVVNQGLDVVCDVPSSLSACKQHLRKQCIDVETLFQSPTIRAENQTISDWYPSLLYYMHSPVCNRQIPGHKKNTNEKSHAGKQKQHSVKAWGYGIAFVSLICCVSNIGGFLAPCMKKDFFQRILMFCVALAAGTLLATGMLILIPESMHLTAKDSPVPDYHLKMGTVLAGIYFFYLSEKLLKFWFTRSKKQEKTEIEITENKISVVENGTHGHSHFPGVMATADEMTQLPLDETDEPHKVKHKHKLTTIALMILTGDALHNLVDGIAIGAAFTENTYLGISVSLSVICEELPHELGDIAILLHTGLNMKRSLCYNFLAALTCYVGLIFGIILGENTNANMWIFAVAGGMFVYISLVDMVPEMTAQAQHVETEGIESKWTVLFIQNLGLVTGFIIIMLLAIYAGNISV